MVSAHHHPHKDDSADSKKSHHSPKTSHQAKKNEFLGSNVRITVCANQGGRKYMEDRVQIHAERSDSGHLEWIYVGVYDGHGGGEASHFAKQHLLNNIVAQDTFDSDDDEEFLTAIREGFLVTHNDMRKVVDQWPRTASGYASTAGTTASVAFIRRGKVYSGHVGDSAIVVGVHETGSSSNSPAIVGKGVTIDHKPDAPEEMKRIEDTGGQVLSKAGVMRVVWTRPIKGHVGPVRRSTPQESIPFLAVARALGDLWSYNAALDQFIVSPDPDCDTLKLTPKHRCMVLGSDGLTNVIKCQGQVEIVNTHEWKELAQDHKGAGKPELLNRPCHSNHSRWMVRHALRGWGGLRADNISVITVIFDPIDAKLPENARCVLETDRDLDIEQTLIDNPEAMIRITPTTTQVLKTAPVELVYAGTVDPPVNGFFSSTQRTLEFVGPGFSSYVAESNTLSVRRSASGNSLTTTATSSFLARRTSLALRSPAAAGSSPAVNGNASSSGRSNPSPSENGPSSGLRKSGAVDRWTPGKIPTPTERRLALEREERERHRKIPTPTEYRLAQERKQRERNRKLPTPTEYRLEQERKERERKRIMTPAERRASLESMETTEIVTPTNDSDEEDESPATSPSSSPSGGPSASAAAPSGPSYRAPAAPPRSQPPSGTSPPSGSGSASSPAAPRGERKKTPDVQPGKKYYCTKHGLTCEKVKTMNTKAQQMLNAGGDESNNAASPAANAGNRSGAAASSPALAASRSPQGSGPPPKKKPRFYCRKHGFTCEKVKKMNQDHEKKQQEEAELESEAEPTPPPAPRTRSAASAASSGVVRINVVSAPAARLVPRQPAGASLPIAVGNPSSGAIKATGDSRQPAQAQVNGRPSGVEAVAANLPASASRKRRRSESPETAPSGSGRPATSSGSSTTNVSKAADARNSEKPSPRLLLRGVGPARGLRRRTIGVAPPPRTMVRVSPPQSRGPRLFLRVSPAGAQSDQPSTSSQQNGSTSPGKEQNPHNTRRKTVFTSKRPLQRRSIAATSVASIQRSDVHYVRYVSTTKSAAFRLRKSGQIEVKADPTASSLPKEKESKDTDGQGPSQPPADKNGLLTAISKGLKFMKS